MSVRRGKKGRGHMGQTVRFEWELPESLLALIVKDESRIAEEVKQAAILGWVRMKKISWRKGADLLGMTYREFLGLMAEHRIPAMDYGEGWLEKELTSFEQSQEKRGP